MRKYPKLHDLSEWACLAYSEHMVLPAKTIYLLAGEARRLLAERDKAVALWREWLNGINYPEGEEDFNDRVEAFIVRAGGGDE